ncbi:MAG: GntR family transcriptional regulator [Pseudomonadota bacterium]
MAWAKLLTDGESQHDARSGERAVSINEEVYKRLRKAIIGGELAPGRALSVRGLAAEFGVSTMPAREAIRRLIALGALEFTASRRVAVATMTKEKLLEIGEARLALEPHLGIRVLRTTLDDEDAREDLALRLTEIADSLEEAIARGDSAAYASLNSDFFYTFYEAANAPVILALVESLWLQAGPIMRIVIGRLGTSSLSGCHQPMIAAIRVIDGEKLDAAIRDNIKVSMSGIAQVDF